MSLRLFVPVAAVLALAAVGAGAGRRLAAVPRHRRRSPGVAATPSARDLEAAVDLRGRRRHRLVRRHRRRRRLCRLAQPASCIAVDLADGKLKWKYKARRTASASRRRRWPAASSTSAISPASCTPSTRATGKAAWTFKTGSEVKSSPVVTGDKVLIGSYDSYLYALGAEDGKLRGRCRPTDYVHATPAVVDGIAYFAGCDEILRGIRVADGKEVSRALVRRVHRRVAGDRRTASAYYGTYENEVLGVDLKTHKIVWRYKHPERNFPFYSSAALAGTRADRRRPRQDACTRSTAHRQGAVDLRRRARGSIRLAVVAGGRVYVGSNDGKLYVLDVASAARACSSSRPAARLRLAGRCRRPRRHRLTGRQVVLSRVGLPPGSTGFYRTLPYLLFYRRRELRRRARDAGARR